MAFHGSIELSSQSAGFFRNRHEHNGADLMLSAPLWKALNFTFGLDVGSGDLHHILYAKPPQVASLPCSRILVSDPAADELEVFSMRRVGKNRNSCRDAILYEVRRFERRRSAGIKRYDNEVGRRDRVADHERPSCGSQKGVPNGGDSKDGSRGQCDHHQRQNPPRQPGAHTFVALVGEILPGATPDARAGPRHRRHAQLSIPKELRRCQAYHVRQCTNKVFVRCIFGFIGNLIKVQSQLDLVCQTQGKKVCRDIFHTTHCRVRIYLVRARGFKKQERRY